MVPNAAPVHIREQLESLRPILGDEAVRIILDPGLTSLEAGNRPLKLYSDHELLKACRGCMIGMAMAWDDIRKLMGRTEALISELGHRHGQPFTPTADVPQIVARGIRCVETGQVFPSIKAAAEAKGGNYNAIDQAVRRGCAAYGFHYERVEDEQDQPGGTAHGSADAAA